MQTKRFWLGLMASGLLVGASAMPSRANMHDGRGMREFEAGMMFVRAGRWVDAITPFNAAINIDPQFAEAYLFRGLGKMVAKDVAGADEDYTAYCVLRPDTAAGFMQRGAARLGQGRPAEAEQDFKHGGDLGGHPVNMYRGLGDCELNLRHYNEAVANYSAAIKLAPQSPTLYQRRAVALQQAGDDRGAKADAAYSDMLVRSGRQLEPADDVSEVMAQAFAGMSSGRGSRGPLPTVIVPEPPPSPQQIRGAQRQADARAQASQATADATTAAQRGDFNAAIKNMAMATSLAPDEPRYWTIKGAFEEQAGQPDAASQSYAKALSLDPKDADAHMGLAIAYGQMKKGREARAEMELGLQTAHRGQVDGALSMATSASAADPQSPLLRELTARLQTARDEVPR